MFRIYESGTNLVYYDQGKAAFVSQDKASGTIGFALNAYYVIGILAMTALVYYYTKKW
jgi:hypothetical protein